MEVNAYVNYYQNQVGGKGFEFGPLYYAPRYIQQGRGFASFFSSAYNFLKPLLVSGFNALKSTALDRGTQILNEMGNRPMKEVLLNHGVGALQDLHKKYKNKFQDGQGLFPFKHSKDIKRNKLNKNKQKVKVLGAVKIKNTKRKKKKKLKTRVLDIFSRIKN